MVSCVVFIADDGPIGIARKLPLHLVEATCLEVFGDDTCHDALGTRSREMSGGQSVVQVERRAVRNTGGNADVDRLGGGSTNGKSANIKGVVGKSDTRSIATDLELGVLSCSGTIVGNGEA